MENERSHQKKIEFLNEELERVKEDNAEKMNNILSQYAKLENSNDKKTQDYDTQVTPLINY